MNPKNILIVRFSSLGDVILATSVISPLKKKFPDAEISFLTKKEFVPVLKANPDLKEVIGLDKDGLKFGEMTKFAESLYGRYDLIIDLHANLRSFLVRIYSTIETLKYKKGSFRRRLMVCHAWTRAIFNFLPEVYKREDSVIANYFKALKPLGISYNGELPVMFTVGQKKKDKTAVGIHAGGKQNTKRWLTERFAEVAEHYAAKGRQVYLFGDEKDKEINAKILSLAKSKQNITDLSGKTTLVEMADKISECAVLITNDSAPFHIATAVGTPAVAIFCATTPKFGFAVRTKTNKILNVELPCKPCSLHGGKKCWKGTFECAKGITVGAVVEGVDELL